MSTSTELEIKVSGGRIINANVMADGSCKLVVEVQAPNTERTVTSQQYGEFVRIPASELTLEDDWFKKHQPNTDEEKEFKKLVQTAIHGGLKDFYRPKYDPSFNEAGTGICYVPNKKTARGKSYNWWIKTANNFNPECKSRLGTQTEYIAFFAVLIKKLVASGWQVQDAWYAVCNDSNELGHYWNSANTEHVFEKTGCREICDFYDLANTYKILAEDEKADGFWRAGGGWGNYSYEHPLANLAYVENRYGDGSDGTGWLVLEENPYTK